MHPHTGKLAHQHTSTPAHQRTCAVAHAPTITTATSSSQHQRDAHIILVALILGIVVVTVATLWQVQRASDLGQGAGLFSSAASCFFGFGYVLGPLWLWCRSRGLRALLEQVLKTESLKQGECLGGLSVISIISIYFTFLPGFHAPKTILQNWSFNSLTSDFEGPSSSLQVGPLGSALVLGFLGVG